MHCNNHEETFNYRKMKSSKIRIFQTLSRLIIPLILDPFYAQFLKIDVADPVLSGHPRDLINSLNLNHD